VGPASGPRPARRAGRAAQRTIAGRSGRFLLGTLVSILIPSFDAAAWVGDAIESALAQTHPEIELVVVDDGSTDDTPAVLERFGGRVRWERGPRRGANAARNRLLELSRGAWLQYLDADDLLLPEKVARQLEAAQEAGADLVASPWRTERGAIRGLRRGADPWVGFFDGALGVTSSNLFRRAALLDAGGWDERRRAAQEVDVLQRLLRNGARVVFVDEALCVKRRVNPRSVWRSIWRDDPVAARQADVSAVAQAMRHLRAAGEMSAAREAAAGARFLRMARSARSRGAGWAEVLAEGRALGLGTSAFLFGEPFAYRAAWRIGGFAAAESAVSLQRRLRRARRRGASSLGRTFDPRRLGPRS
jgi:cellulose synthase/poly-beta-1,6-N-acetylglucosamine synthase-like glycosyltransferase